LSQNSGSEKQNQLGNVEAKVYCT